jgi:magnesium-transporting ATPase (P-type)
VAALKAGCDLGDLARRWPRLREIPFDPATRLMATLHETPEDDRTWVELTETHQGLARVGGLAARLRLTP